MSDAELQIIESHMEIEIAAVGRGPRDYRTSDCVRLTIQSNPTYPEQAEWLRAIYRTVADGRCDEDEKTIKEFFGYA